jgi:hypothetical protein
MQISRYYTRKWVETDDGPKCLVPAVILGNGEYVLGKIIEDLDYDREDITCEHDESIVLDPGGMISTAEENQVSFEVDGIKFRSYWDKLGRIIDEINHGDEHVEGYLRFRQHLSFQYIPVDFAEKLKDKLLELNFSPEADAQVARDKAFKRRLMEEGKLGGIDADGNFRTGPGSSELLK